ncbi:MAG: response regulator [Desulfobacter sp.]|uniref:response regulator n=1 Tax=uncultured Desulfobacter sp. TaxID=240139 RepID=UPI0029C95963|nr:response regulator [uncultured Desulfobacter sp.]MCW8799464.1 response regulator [Desulfobacter sp.]
MHQETLLIIDDEISIRESLAFLFEDEGYRVFTAENGHMGLDLFFRENVDVVITDLRMPVMDGLEVMRTIHESDPDLPMIVISGAGKKQDVIQALKMGAKDYISKPIIDLDIIIHTVSKVFENRRLAYENKVYSERLEKSEKQYRTITEQIAEGVFTVDAQENITFVNPAFCKMTGFPTDKLLSMNLEQISTRDSFLTILEQTQLRKKGKNGRYEIQLVRANKHPIHVELTCSPINQSNDQTYTGAIIMARDISRRIELQRQYEQFITCSQDMPEHAIAICANCKKIRGKDDLWKNIEKAFDHLIFSHGICPDCCEKLYPDLNFEETKDDPGFKKVED